MENLIINQTEETPEINFNVNGNCSIIGVSIPENVADFYTPVVEWLCAWENSLPNQISLVIEIEYINTSSTRAFIDLVKKFVSIKYKCPDTKIIWRYEKDDEDNLDLGKDLEFSAKANFVFEAY